MLIVAPGAMYSTFDTFRYYERALRRAGCNVKLFRYHNNYMYHSAAIASIEHDGSPPLQDASIGQRSMQLAGEDLISRIARQRPDVLLVVSGIALPVAVWPWLKEMQRSLKNPFKMVMLFTECPYVDEWQLKILPFLDAAFIMDMASLNAFQDIQPKTYYLPHAFDPAVHKPFDVGPGYQSDIFMCGTGFPERQELLENINWDGIDLRLFGQWDFASPDSPIASYITNDFLENDIVVSWYNGAKICLNIFRTATWYGDDVAHIPVGLAESLGPRCFEVTASGGFLLTDHRPEWDILFGPECAAIYSNAEELEAKIAYFLSHDEERERIAKRGLAAVQPHTYDRRAQQILSILEEVN